jgi:hypothetical protein
MRADNARRINFCTEAAGARARVQLGGTLAPKCSACDRTGYYIEALREQAADTIDL